MATDWGPVLDISVSGLRVKCGIKPPRVGEVFFISIEGGESAFSVMVACRWTRRVGLLHHEVGLEFVRPLPEIQSTLNEITRCLRAGADASKFGWGE